MTGQRLRQAVRSAWMGVGAVCLILTGMEGAVRLITALPQWRALMRPAAIDVRPQGGGPGRPAWANEYGREFEESYQLEWHPYVYWRRKPYQGKYVNVDASGVRRTWNPTVSPSPGQLKILMVGGSTMWGTGARDEYTIPSLTSKKLARSRTPEGAWVSNHAETGYVSTQEIITVMLALRKGNIPDVVVFLDGVNDTFSAFQSGTAGIPQNETFRAIEFNSRDRLNPSGFVKQLALFKLSARVVQGILGPRFEASDPWRHGTSAASVPDEVVNTYLRNVALVESLATQFGFRAVFFWQPTVLSKKQRSQEEQRFHDQLVRRIPGAVAFFDKTYKTFSERVGTGKTPNVYDLSGIFDDEPGSMFVGQFHFSEEANDKIADLMARTIVEIARQANR